MYTDKFLHYLRSDGQSPKDRAVSYAAARLWKESGLMERIAQSRYILDKIEHSQSAICRPRSDCHDVEFRFFHSDDPKGQPRKVHFLRVDVMGAVPVLLGSRSSWNVY